MLSGQKRENKSELDRPQLPDWHNEPHPRSVHGHTASCQKDVGRMGMGYDFDFRADL